MPGSSLPEGLLENGDPPRLIVGRCPLCDALHFPAGDTCPYCGAEGCVSEPVDGRGSLWAWTAVNSAPPGYNGPVPYGFGVVELPAGLRVIGRITESDPSRLRSGQPMALDTTELPGPDGEPMSVWAFAPVEDAT